MRPPTHEPRPRRGGRGGGLRRPLTWLVTSVRKRCRYTLPGLWTALVFALLSFTPSLLPRPALFQGVVSGVDGAIGYGLGVLGAWVWRQYADRDAHRSTPWRGESWPSRHRCWR